MALKLMYITNRPAVAQIAEKAGVECIWVDLEILGKEERQRYLNTVKSHHTIEDVGAVAQVLTTSELMVRINMWNENSVSEIEQAISAGADRIMLPMWKTPEEADLFLKTVNKRVHTTLLLETKEAVECLPVVLDNPLLEEIHIGLNDLHLSYGLTFLFELLSNGTVEALCNQMKAKGVSYGFGGIARIGEGKLPAEQIVMEHYRLGSTRAILSRSFCNTDKISDLDAIDSIFRKNVAQLRAYEATLTETTEATYAENIQIVKNCVDDIVKEIKEKIDDE